MKKDKTKREVTLKFSIPKVSTMVHVLLAVFGVYFLSYLLVNSYAKTNGLPKKAIINPLRWFVAKPTLTPFPTLTPTNTPIPTATPTIKPKPVVRKVVNPTVAPNNSDPIVNCAFSTTKCGADKQMRNSECQNSTCCGINDKYYITTKDQCNQDQASYGNNTNSIETSNLVQVSLYRGTMTVYCKPEVVQTLKDLEPIMEQKSKTYVDTCTVASSPSNCETLKNEAYQAEENYKAVFFKNCVNKK